MEISQLRMFKLVADLGSIIRASEQMHCVPSNITTRIKLLEKELGVSLFIRQGRGLVISPAGSTFLDYTNRILSLCTEARRALEPESAFSGQLNIGAIESAATGRLPGPLGKYHEVYPSVQLQLNTGTWDKLIKDVLQHKLDGAIIANVVEHADIAQQKLYEEDLVLISSLPTGAVTDVQDLENINIFMWPEGCPYRNCLTRWLAKHDVTSTITNIASYATIIGCVSSGAGVSFIPEGMYDRFKSIGNISCVKFNDLLPVANYFIWNRQSGEHRRRDAFVELLMNEFKDIRNKKEG